MYIKTQLHHHFALECTHVMEQRDAGLPLTLQELDKVSNDLAISIASHATKLSTIINNALTLLENFKFQIDKFKNFGDCDYELAYVCYSVSLTLVEQCSRIKGYSTNDLLHQIIEALDAQLSNFQSIKNHTHESDPLKSSANDPLLARYSKLKSSATVALANLLPSPGSPDYISAQGLNNIIRDPPRKVLLIDFRSKREYAYSHLNFLNIVNVDPLLVHEILKTNKFATDTDLEKVLKVHIDPEMFRLFTERNTFDEVVLYNLRFGGISDDKFSSLEYLIVNGDKSGLPSESPFRELIKLLVYRTTYLSSRLRHYPKILRGGLEKWYQVFGLAGLTSTLNQNSELIKRSDLMNMKSDFANSQESNSYLRNFGEYLSSGLSTGAMIKSRNAHENLHRNPSTLKDSLTNRRGTPNAFPRSTSPSKGLLALTPEGPKSSAKSSVTEPQRTNVALESCQPKKANRILETFTTGLTNLGNSCYMNCILQCLSATPLLSHFFFLVADSGNLVQPYKQHINLKNLLGSKGVITTSFVHLLADMYNSSGKYFRPTTFRKVVGQLSPALQFASNDQQDCIEFLNFILDSLHEDLNQRVVDNAEERATIMDLSLEQEKIRESLPIRLASTIEWERYLKLNFSIIVDYFQGQYLSQLRCLECQLTSTTYNAFSILSLPIPERTLSKKSVLLAQCLDLFTETELLDDNNKWHCPDCKRFTRSTKKITLTRFPRVLIIHFKRFSVSSTGNFKKLETFIDYPVNDVLSMTPYWPSVGSYAVDAPSQIISTDKEQSILDSFPERNQKPPFDYKLYGVANHFGNLTTGHYTAFVRKSSDSTVKRDWCYFDDARVTMNCGADQVLTKSAYCLFYQRV